MYDRVYIFRHVFFKAIPVCFSTQRNHPAFCLVIVALILPSTNTASWSLIPGMTWVLIIRLSLLVINKSTTFLPRVGLVISWTQQWLSRQSVNFRVNSGKRHVRNRQLCFQSNPGRFMSPAYEMRSRNVMRSRHQTVGVISQSFSSSFGLGLQICWTRQIDREGGLRRGGQSASLEVRIRNLILAL